MEALKPSVQEIRDGSPAWRETSRLTPLDLDALAVEAEIARVLSVNEAIRAVERLKLLRPDLIITFDISHQIQEP